MQRSMIRATPSVIYSRYESTRLLAFPRYISTSRKSDSNNAGHKIDPNPMKSTPKPSIWSKVKHEAHHYWDGTKLLGFEVKISFKLLMKLSAGRSLTRREMLQLKRTTSDVVRLVPFAAFVLVPFAELLLPIALKLFPNLLPSTYESSQSRNKKLENLKKTRLLMSDIIKEQNTHFKPTNITDEQKKLFNSFYTHIRATGEPESREQLIAVAKLFTDDTVLDNVTRSHLVALAKYMNLQPFGTDVMLRYRIRFKMLDLKKDDLSLYYEDAEQLDSTELRTACASRGIRTVNVTDEVLKDNLRLWLKMRLKEKIPTTLLIMATAYNYGDIKSAKSLYGALCDVLGAIPDELYHEVKVNVVEDHVSPKQKLAQLKEQEEIMGEEEQQEKAAYVQIKDDLSLDQLDKDYEAAAKIPEPNNSERNT